VNSKKFPLVQKGDLFIFVQLAVKRRQQNSLVKREGKNDVTDSVMKPDIASRPNHYQLLSKKSQHFFTAI